MGEFWDAHAHVIGDPGRFPFAPGRSYTPDPAPLDDYLAMLDRHGIERGVLIQPSAYGTDNACLLDALDRARGRLAGIVVPAPDAGARDLEAMHTRGVRGVRVNLINPGTVPLDAVLGWRPVLRALGWHIELHVEIEEVEHLEGFVRQFDVPVVIDHMGRPSPGRTDPSRPFLKRLIELVRDDECFVKVSAPYRLSAAPPPWDDVRPLAEALIDANPRGCLWGTDWPHVHTPQRIRVDDLLNALDRWCPDASLRRTVTSTAAEALFARMPLD